MAGDLPNKLRVVATREKQVTADHRVTHGAAGPVSENEGQGSSSFALLPALLFLVAATASGAAVAYLRAAGGML